jgi:hypothetical protein
LVCAQFDKVLIIVIFFVQSPICRSLKYRERSWVDSVADAAMKWNGLWFGAGA